MGRVRAKGRDVCGILLLDKPSGMTSNRALQTVRRLFDARKAGHTGSLDPLATGLLPLCFGAATKLSGYLLDAGKTYQVTGLMGVATDTGDADGAVIATRDDPRPTIADIGAAIGRFTGEIDQVPPMYSALKQSGRRLYELARQGVEVERAARRVRIGRIDLEHYEWPEIRFSVSCSKGTYVRSLLCDIAAAVGTIAHVTALRRVALGPFQQQDMVTVPALRQKEAEGGFAALDSCLLSPILALEGWLRVTLSDEQAARMRQGARLTANPGWPVGDVAIVDSNGALVGIGEVTAGGELISRRLM